MFTFMPTANPVVPSEETIRRALGEFRLSVDDEQVVNIQQYIKLLLIWNEKVNLTAIRDPLEVLYRHFCESMFATAAVPLMRGRLADVGSGGGFPGVPLKIIRPDLHLFLIESNVKKATFIAEVVRELGLLDVRVLVSRYEELGEEVAPLDCACSRAVGEIAPFLEWAGSEQIACKQVILWVGGRDLAEVQNLPGWQWQEPVTIPHSLRRYILAGTKCG
jgi:16S rRNA (guanine527-N7)-methyltransferase